MSTWQTLYIKEIKEHRTLFILLPLVTAFLELVAVLSFDDEQGLSPHFLWSVVPYAFLLILPFLLVHSFAQEVKGQTHYLLLSLPVSRARIFAAKAAAVATLGLVLGALSTAGLIAVVGQLQALAARVMTLSMAPFTATDLLVVSGSLYLSALAVMLGMAGGVAGLKLVVRRFAGLATAAFVLGVLYCYFRALPEVLGTSEVLWFDYSPNGPDKPNESNEPMGISPDFIKANLVFLAYSIGVGLGAMGIGMWLFEKRAEA